MPRLALAPFLLLMLPIAPAGASAQESARTVSWSVDSPARPCVRALVAGDLDFIGRVEGAVMNGRARAERFLFGEVVDGSLRRAVIVHFEGMVDASGTFDYPRFRMDTLAGAEYLHQVWPIPAFDLFTTEPFASLLLAHDIDVEADWLVNRWARVVDAERRNEILLFYLEPSSAFTVPIATMREDWQPQGIAGSSHGALEAAFIERARAALRLERRACGAG